MLIKTQNLSGQMNNKDGVVSCGQPLWHGTTEGSVLKGARGRDSLRGTARWGMGGSECVHVGMCV